MLPVSAWIVVPIPLTFLSRPSSQQVESLNNWMCNLSDPSRAFDLECDSSASCPILDRVVIESVRVIGESIEVQYVVEFSEYRACLMESHRWVIRRQLTGMIESERLLFPPFIPTDRKSTLDEL
jgi:hypothetical protein